MSDKLKSRIRSLPLVGPIARYTYLSVFGAGGTIDHLRYLRYGILGEGWICVNTGDESVWLRCETVTETRRATSAIRQERPVINELRSMCDPGMVVFDIGANVGTHGLITAKAVKETGTVVCFEPHVKTFESLTANIDRNSLENIISENLALGQSSGTTELHIEHDEPGVGSHSLIRRTENLETTEKTKVMRGDEYVKQYDLKPDLVKIDVEGGELDVLKGMRKTLENTQPQLVVEIHDSVDTEAIKSFLHDCGYSLSWIGLEKDILTAQVDRENR